MAASLFRGLSHAVLPLLLPLLLRRQSRRHAGAHRRIVLDQSDVGLQRLASCGGARGEVFGYG